MSFENTRIEALLILNTQKMLSYSEYFDKPTVIVWHWDSLKRKETPEEYFERHAKMIEEAGGLRVYGREAISTEKIELYRL